jgi:hypothetical protein
LSLFAPPFSSFDFRKSYTSLHNIDEVELHAGCFLAFSKKINWLESRILLVGYWQGSLYRFRAFAAGNPMPAYRGQEGSGGEM